jgi:hypothetical protein
MKCVGNCAVCELEVDKSICCQVQILKQIIEVKRLLVELNEKDSFADIPDIESEPTPSARRKNNKEGLND